MPKKLLEDKDIHALLQESIFSLNIPTSFEININTYKTVYAIMG